MEKEPCVICGRDAVCVFISGDKYDYRCENCGKYYFLDDLNKFEYKKKLDEKDREKISKYIKEYNEARGEWATLGDLETLLKKVEDFNRKRKKNEK